MVTLKKLRSVGLYSLLFMFGLFVQSGAFAQTPDAQILTTNVDVQNKKLYVELAYTPKACGDFQLRFKLQTKTQDLGYTAIKLRDILTNKNSADTGSHQMGGSKITTLLLDNTAVGGYYLEFDYTPTLTAADSPVVCVETYRVAYRCRQCGADRSDIVFTPKDMDAQCPYLGEDVVACSKRVGGAKNWEAYIQDPRDCQMYRIVQMPDGNWWLAQNLNYQKELEHQTNPNPAQNGAAGTGNYGTMTAANRFWCPSSNSGQNQGVETGPGNFRRGCEVFGALYTPITARMNDGNNFSTSGVPTFGTPISGVSTTASSLRGVCPPNWVLPSDYDWGVLLNYVEDNCPSPTSATDGNQRNPLVPPCNHVSTINDNQWLGYSAGRYLKGTYTCAANEGNCAKIVSNDLSVDKWNFTSSPAWSASSYDVAGVDRFGFTVLPAGWRDGTYNAQNFKIWGEVARFVTASTQDGNVAAAYYDVTKYREFSYDRRDVQRASSGTATANYSTHAYSVRCLRRP